LNNDSCINCVKVFFNTLNYRKKAGNIVKQIKRGNRQLGLVMGKNDVSKINTILETAKKIKNAVIYPLKPWCKPTTTPEEKDEIKKNYEEILECGSRINSSCAYNEISVRKISRLKCQEENEKFLDESLKCSECWCFKSLNNNFSTNLRTLFRCWEKLY